MCGLLRSFIIAIAVVVFNCLTTQLNLQQHKNILGNLIAIDLTIPLVQVVGYVVLVVLAIVYISFPGLVMMTDLVKYGRDSL